MPTDSGFDNRSAGGDGIYGTQAEGVGGVKSLTYPLALSQLGRGIRLFGQGRVLFSLRDEIRFIGLGRAQQSVVHLCIPRYKLRYFHLLTPVQTEGAGGLLLKKIISCLKAARLC